MLKVALIVAVSVVPSLAFAVGNQYDAMVVQSVKKPSKKRVKVKSVKKTKLTAETIFDRYSESMPRGNVSLRGVAPELAAFARKIVVNCGSKVISAVRHTNIAGTSRRSLHASGRAVDIAGNPACIASHLRGWDGGASNDYHRVRPNHYHISIGGFEHGKRFAHGYSKRKRVRIAGR